MPESTQHKLDRIRPPRVQITYDVETGGAIQKKELPLVVGILADLSGQQETPAPRLKDCKFVDIDRDNFNQVMASIGPRLAMAVDNKVAGEGKTNVELHFKSLDDFEPLAVVKQVEVLRQLLEARQKLSDLLAKLDGNDALDTLLVNVAKNPDEIKQLKPANIPAGNGDKANG